MFRKPKFLCFLTIFLPKNVKHKIKNHIVYPLISSLAPLIKDQDCKKHEVTIHKHWGIISHEELIREADRLFNQNAFLQVYELLNKIKYSHNADVQWRISRALFKLASDKSLPKDIRESMILEAYVLMNDTVSLGAYCSK